MKTGNCSSPTESGPSGTGPPNLLWQKLHDRYFTKMKESDLHFFMGTESQVRQLARGRTDYPKRGTASSTVLAPANS